MQTVMFCLAASSNAMWTAATKLEVIDSLLSVPASSPSQMKKLDESTDGGLTPAGKSPAAGVITRSMRSCQPFCPLSK